MAVSNTNSKDRYLGNGANPYSITFDFVDDAHIYVDVVDSSGVLVAEALTNGSGIVVTGSSLVTDTPYDDTHIVTIYRQVPYTQPTDLSPSGALPVDTLEGMVDNVVRQVQQVNDSVGSFLRLSVNDADIDPLPTAASRRNKVAYFEDDATASLVAISDSDLQVKVASQATSDGKTNTETLLKADASGDLTLNQVNAHLVSFNTSNGGPVNTGEVAWDSANGTLDLIGDGNVKIELGEKNLTRIKNTSGSTINKGAPLVFTGTTGATGRINVAAWDGANVSEAKTFVGFAAAQIGNNQDGYAISFGKLTGIDTSGSAYSENWNDGDIIYAIPSSSSDLSKTKPVSGDFVVAAAVLKAGSGTSGSLFVRTSFDKALGTASLVDANQDLTTSSSVTFNSLTCTALTATGSIISNSLDPHYLMLSDDEIACLDDGLTSEASLTIRTNGVPGITADSGVIEIKAPADLRLKAGLAADAVDGNGDVILEGDNRGAAIADLSTGGAETNANICIAINAILATLRSHGLISN